MHEVNGCVYNRGCFLYFMNDSVVGGDSIIYLGSGHYFFFSVLSCIIKKVPKKSSLKYASTRSAGNQANLTK